MPEEALERLLEFVGPTRPLAPDGRVLTLISPGHLSATFLAEVEAVAGKFTGHFTDAILRNLDLDTNGMGQLEKRLIVEAKGEVARTFRAIYQLEPLCKRAYRIVHDTWITGTALHTGLRVSSAHGTKRKGDSEGGGGTLAERQARFDQIKAARRLNHGQAEPPTAEHRDKRARVADGGGKTSGDTTSGGMNAAGGDIGRGDVTSDVPTADAAQAGVGAMYSAAARKMMARMGFTEGAGLGAQGQGRATPVEVQERQQLAGLGFAAHLVPDAARGMQDAPWFHDEDGPGEVTWLEHNAEASPTRNEVDGWSIVTAPALPAVSMSKFARPKVLQKLQKARREGLPAALEALAAEPALEAALFACAAAQQQHRTMADAPFVNADGALLMAQLDSMLGIVAHRGRSDGVADGNLYSFAVLSPAAEGLGEYVARKMRKRCRGFVTAETATPPPSWAHAGSVASITSLDPVYDGRTSAGVAAVVRQLGTDTASGPCLDIALAAISADPATEVAGPGNSHLERLGKRSALVQVLAALQTLAEGGTLVLQLTDVFTRFTAGLVNVLHHSFRRTRLLKPFMCDPMRAQCVVVCLGLLPCSTILAAHLQATLKTLESLPAGDDVLAFLPMTRLLRPGFMRHVTMAVERFAQRECAAILEVAALARRGPGTEELRSQAVGLGDSALALINLDALVAQSQVAGRQMTATGRASVDVADVVEADVGTMTEAAAGAMRDRNLPVWRPLTYP